MSSQAMAFDSPNSSREPSLIPARNEVRSFSLGAKGDGDTASNVDKRESLASFSLEIAMLSTMTQKLEKLSSMPKQLEALGNVPKQLEAMSKSLNNISKQLADFTSNSPVASDCEYKIRIDEKPFPEYQEAPFSQQAYNNKARRISNCSAISNSRRVSTTSMLGNNRRVSSASVFSAPVTDRRQSSVSGISVGGFSHPAMGNLHAGMAALMRPSADNSPRMLDGHRVWKQNAAANPVSANPTPGSTGGSGLVDVPPLVGVRLSGGATPSDSLVQKELRQSLTLSEKLAANRPVNLDECLPVPMNFHSEGAASLELSVGVGSMKMDSIHEKADTSMELEQYGSAATNRDDMKVAKCMSFASLGGADSDYAKPFQIWELASTHDKRLPKMVLLPHSHWRLLWDVVVVMSTLFVTLTISIGLGYYRGCQHDHVLSTRRDLGIVLCWMDLVWVMDILINFRTGFFYLGRLQLAPKAIASWYIQRWLIVDMLAAWPLVVSRLTEASCWLFWVGYSCKLLRLLRMGPSIGRLCGHYRRKTSVKVIVYLLCFTHVTACAWRLAQRADGMYEDPVLNVAQLYVQDAYWVIMTMTTVGYGDIAPGGTFTCLYAIFVMCIASLFFGTTISALTHVTRALFQDEVENRVVSVTEYMKRRNLPRELQRRVALNLRRRIHQNNQTTMDPAILALLSPAMQRELLLSLLSTTVLEFPLFKGAHHSFVADIAQAHSWLNCSPTDIVVAAGQIMQDVFFVISGSVVGRRSVNNRFSEPWSDSDGRQSGQTTVSNTEDANSKHHDDKQKAHDDKPELGPPRKSLSNVSANNRPLSPLSYSSENSKRDLQPISPSSSYCHEGPKSGSSFISSRASSHFLSKEQEYGAGAWYGEACLFDNDLVHHSTFISVCDSELAVLAQKDYFTIINKYPRLLERHRYFEKKLHDGTLNIDLLAYKAANHRNSITERGRRSFFTGPAWTTSRSAWLPQLFNTQRNNNGVKDFNSVFDQAASSEG